MPPLLPRKRVCPPRHKVSHLSQAESAELPIHCLPNKASAIPPGLFVLFPVAPERQIHFSGGQKYNQIRALRGWNVRLGQYRVPVDVVDKLPVQQLHAPNFQTMALRMQGPSGSNSDAVVLEVAVPSRLRDAQEGFHIAPTSIPLLDPLFEPIAPDPAR